MARNFTDASLDEAVGIGRLWQVVAALAGAVALAMLFAASSSQGGGSVGIAEGVVAGHACKIKLGHVLGHAAEDFVRGTLLITWPFRPSNESTGLVHPSDGLHSLLDEMAVLRDQSKRSGRPDLRDICSRATNQIVSSEALHPKHFDLGKNPAPGMVAQVDAVAKDLAALERWAFERRGRDGHQRDRCGPVLDDATVAAALVLELRRWQTNFASERARLREFEHGLWELGNWVRSFTDEFEEKIGRDKAFSASM
jgi:hypothetical protein